MQKSQQASLWLIPVLFLLSLLLTLRFLATPPAASGALSPNIVISQIYGGGGNSGAPFTHDFIELFNRGNTTVNITGWSVQYAGATSSSWAMVTLSGSLAPGQYYLIRGASGGGSGVALPTPDVTSTLALAATAGKVALVNNSTLLSGTGCPFAASVVDFVGYGATANCSETAPAPAPSNTTAILRAGNGCVETDNNATDFSTAAPNPRNTASPQAPCGAPTNPTGVGMGTPNPVVAGNMVLLTVNVTPGANPTSTGITVIGDLTMIGGSATQMFFDDGTNGDAVAGDNTFSFQMQVPANVTPGMKTLPVMIADAQMRSSSTAINLTVIAPPPPGAVVISQIFGGGGNSGAPFMNDYIELFNRSNMPVSIAGWSVQYATATGGTWQKVDLSGTLAPGQYYLVQLDSAGANGAPLPPPDATGTIAMSSTAGKVALVNNTTLLSGSCPFGPSVVDFVGYGSTANCFEGTGPTPAPSSTTAVLRRMNGCTDTNNNAADFMTGVPNPRNSAAPPMPCGAPTNPSGTGAASPNPVPAGNVVLLTVNVTPGTNPPSTGLAVTANLTMIGGAPAQMFFDDGTNGDAVAGDNVFSFQTQLPSSIPPGLKVLPVTITDAQSRVGATTINLIVVTPPPPGNVVISQIFGGGGNSDAPFTHDFIEIFNRSNAPVSITGWSIQYTSSTGGTWQKVDLSGTLAPGQYYLIQLASSGMNGAPLPPPDATGTIVMAATAGKVALVNNTVLLSGSCPFGTSVVDFVGYGSTANCFEGLGPAPAPSSERAAFRSGLGCIDNNDNASDFFTAPPQPKNTAAPFNPCGMGARFENLTVTLSDPNKCSAAGNIVTIVARFTNSGTSPQGDNPGAEFTAQLPPSLVALSGSCTTMSGACQIVSPSQVEWNGAVRINETITITFQAQITDRPLTGANLCVTGTLNFDSDINGRNDTTITHTGCLSTPCATVGPGLVYPASSEVSDQKPGSVLIYPLYSSNTMRLARENALISITNTDPARRVAVHLFFIQDDENSVADAYICLTPNQTASFLASDIDPDITGYLVAVATDERTGCPINFNFLIGDVYVKLESGHAANLAAEAFAALAGAPVACDGNSVTAEINFDGISYNRAPRVLAASSISSPVDGNSTLIVIDRIGGNLATGVSTVGQIFGLFYDDRENGFSFEFPASRRQFRFTVSNTIPRTTPRVTELVPAGHSGWMKFWRTTDGGIIGAQINFNPDAARRATAFNQGHNLHKLTLTTEASFTIPIFPPRC